MLKSRLQLMWYNKDKALMSAETGKYSYMWVDGRGLSLQLGSYTHVRQIDQVDIIAHQPFKELLKTENILVQFGPVDAVDDNHAASEQIVNAAQSANTGTAAATSPTPASSDRALVTQGMSPVTGSTTGETAGQPSPSSVSTHVTTPTFLDSVGFTSIDESGIQDDGTQGQLGHAYVERNPSLADVSYYFPCTTVSLSNPIVNLSRIDLKKIDEAASRVTSTGNVPLRKGIVSTLGKCPRTMDTENAEVGSLSVNDKDAATALLRLMMNENLLPANEKNKRIAKSFPVKRFMESAPIDHWTIKSPESAISELRGLVHKFVADTLKSRMEETKITPLKMSSLDKPPIPFEGTCTSKSRRKQSLYVTSSTAAGSSRFSKQSRLIPIRKSICWQDFSIPRHISGVRGCALRCTLTSLITPGSITRPISTQLATSTSTGLSRARICADVTTRSYRQSVGQRSLCL